MQKAWFVFYIIIVGFLVNLVWENAQAPLYEGYTNFWDHFMICFWASLVDAVVILLLYALLATWYKDFYWIKHINWASAIVLIILGAAIAVGFEQWAFASNAWRYTDQMPVILFGTGLSPLLQMMLLPLFTFFVIRMMLSNKKELKNERKNEAMTDKEIFDKTKKVIYENMIKGHLDGRQTTFHYTKPSPGTYPFQFFWDTCFHVFILSALGEHNMAKEHLVSLFAMQQENGFVGHMIYWDRLRPGRLADIFQSKPGLKNLFKSHMSALIQPPLVAQAVARLYEVSGDKAFLHVMVPKLKKYFRWLAQHRDFQADGLITIISPFESGIDWKPTFDVVVGFPQKRADWRLFLKVVNVDFRNYINKYNLNKIYKKGYFLVKEVGFNTIYAQNLQALAGLCSELGEEQEAMEFTRLGQKVSRSILEVMYDKKDAAFYDVYGKENIKIRILTPTIFYPVVLKSLPEDVKEKIIKKHFFNSEEFDTPYPIPSVAKSHPSFNPTASMYIWRGPTWIVHNWFMHQFLMENGYRNESKRLIDSIKKLIKISGFREYYNPFTGEGYGAEDFTWAGLVLDMIQMETGEKITKSR